MKCSLVPVGSVAPDFAFGAGGAVPGRLSEYRGRGVVLIFFRGHWCQSCRRQLAQLGSALETINLLGAELLAVSADSAKPEDAANRGFPIVAAGLRIIDQYGLRDVDDADGHQIARPAVFIIDAAGVVRFCHVGLHRQDRPALGSILLAAESLLDGGS